MENFAASLMLALIGMGVVFTFLALLVALICAMGVGVARFAPPALEGPEDDVAAISAALAVYFARQRTQHGGKG